jgi:hypothetical protein
MSVRKKEDKMNRIEELKEERLARRKAKAVEERRKNIKKIKRRRQRSVLAVIIIIIVIGIISGVAAYINYLNTSTFNERADVPEQTEQPTETAAPAVVVGDVKGNGDGTTASATETVKDGFTSTKIAGMSFAYPSSFTEETGKNVLLYLTDGEAEITANKTVVNQEPKALLKKYADETGGTATDSSANDTGYDATISVGASIHHKKSRVENGTETYYEIKYPASSSNAALYDEYIKYMDTFF